MRLNLIARNNKIIDMYKKGYSYRQIRKKYKVSPNTIRKLTKNIQVKCSICGKVKGEKEKFQQHHPNREANPNYTIPVCLKCHKKITQQELSLKKQQTNIFKPLNIRLALSQFHNLHTEQRNLDDLKLLNYLLTNPNTAKSLPFIAFINSFDREAAKILFALLTLQSFYRSYGRV
jgi:hypothetical protein